MSPKTIRPCRGRSRNLSPGVERQIPSFFDTDVVDRDAERPIQGRGVTPDRIPRPSAPSAWAVGTSPSGSKRSRACCTDQRAAGLCNRLVSVTLVAAEGRAMKSADSLKAFRR